MQFMDQTMSSIQPACSGPHFPLYELQQIAMHDTGGMGVPSPMDLLCEIVNSSDCSDRAYSIASPIVCLPASHFQQSLGREQTFLDILCFGGSKAMEMTGYGVQDSIGHQRCPPHYTIQQSSQPPTFSPIIPPMQDFSPDIDHFKLPLLEQEPETSITNSQVDEEVKRKEIRRNLERSIMSMQQFGEMACSRQLPFRESAIFLSDTHASMQGQRHGMSSCFNGPGACEGISGYLDSAMVDKVSSTCGGAEEEKNEMKGFVEEARGCRQACITDEEKRRAAASHGEKKSSSSSSRVKPMAGPAGRAHVNLLAAAGVSVEGSKASAQTAVGSKRQLHVEASLANSAKRARIEESMMAADQRAAAAMETSPLQTNTGTTHISVERNRRKQMNEHLALLRSLMPASYVQRSDQASIIGGVVEFIKELQQLLASLETQKRRRAYAAEALSPRGSNAANQVSPRTATQELVATSRSPLADVEVKLAGGAHVVLRTLCHKATRGQLLHLIAALECMSLEILHLNITTLQQAILYTFTLKIGIECRLSVDDLANVGQQIFKDIHARKL